MFKRFRVVMILAVWFVGAAGLHAQQGKSVLLPASESERLRKSYEIQGSKIGGYWQPTAEELSSLEANIPKISALHSEGAIVGAQIEHPENYSRQYLAITLNGKKTIYVSAFCEAGPPNPTHWTIVSDGGTCVWRAIYDVETQTFSHLLTNGRA